jgi:predicted PurR-regulated permease PerM
MRGEGPARRSFGRARSTGPVQMTAGAPAVARSVPAEPGTADVTAPGATSPDAVPRSLRVAAAWSWRLLLVALAIAVVVVGMGLGKVLWVPVVLALLLTVLLSPFVDMLQKRVRFGRGLASGAAVIALLVVVAGLMTLAGREIVQGFGELWDQASEGFDELLVTLASGPLGLDSAQIEGYVDQAKEQLSSNSGALVSGALSVTTTVGHVLAGAVVTLFCLFFFLKDGPLIWAWLIRLLPGHVRMPAYEASRRGVVTLAAFTRTQILVAAIDAIGIGAGALILGIPLAIPLAVLVFLASFIPFVGAIATGVIAVLVALVDQGTGPALIMLAIVVLVQQLESHILQPLLLGHAVSLHPVAVLLSVAAGSLAGGIVGALFAVPFVATLNTVVLYLHGRDKFPHLGRDPEGLHSRLRQLDGPEGPAEKESVLT